MRTFLTACVAALGLGLVAWTVPASAQFVPGQPYQPYKQTVSPYINLARPGNPGINYFGQVKPQLEVYNKLQTLQMQQAQLAQLGTGAPLVEDGVLSPVAITGHGTSFMSFGHYYYQGLGSSGGLAAVPTPQLLGPRPLKR
jgi:hypothetical protein